MVRAWLPRPAGVHTHHFFSLAASGFVSQGPSGVSPPFFCSLGVIPVLNHWLPVCVGFAVTFTIYLLARVVRMLLVSSDVDRSNEIDWK